MRYIFGGAKLLLISLLQGLTFLGRTIVSFYFIVALVTFYSRGCRVIWKLFPTFQYEVTRTTNLHLSPA